MRRGSRTARQAAILVLIGSGHWLLYLAIPATVSVTRLGFESGALTLQLEPPPVHRPPPPLHQPQPQQLPGGRERAAPGMASVPVQTDAALREDRRPAARDWAGAAERAARAAGVSPPRRGFGMPAPVPAPAVAVPEFGWSRARTRPIEPLETGGFVYHINDRCAVVVVFVPLPFCRMGTIPPRGDLFDHLHDAPVAGDWKDPR